MYKLAFFGALSSFRVEVSLASAIVFLLALFALASPSIVLANNGPHGGYTTLTDACAACHRAHTGVSDNLLVLNSIYALCTTCHGSTGSGANTDVLDGTYYVNRVPGSAQQGDDLGTLSGGGFLNIHGTASTSAHNVNGLPAVGYQPTDTSGTGKTAPAWGGGTAVGLGWDGGSPAKSTVALECTSCHDPHGTEGYRILRDGSTAISWAGANNWPVVKGETMPASQWYTKGGGYDAADMNSWCANCHSNYVLQSSTYQAFTDKPAMTYYRHTVSYSPGCLTCHRAHGTTATMTGFAVQVLGADGIYRLNTNTVNGVAAGIPPENDSALLRIPNRGVCAVCHVKNGMMPGQGCDVCHRSPPPTGSHLKHYSPTSTVQPAYGRTGNLSSGTEYTMGCGECHPTDHSQHNNGARQFPSGGSAEIELYRSGYPLGLKSLNPPSAIYTPGPILFTDAQGYNYTQGTCSNVYCHSANTWTSTVVNWPPSGVLDANGNLAFNPYTVTVTRQYKAMTWGSGSLSCNGCHGNPPRSYEPADSASAGNTHSWINSSGYESGHNSNMDGRVDQSILDCRTCHYDTVRSAATFTQDAKGVKYPGDVPIFAANMHVNGQKNVAFDTVDQVSYTWWGDPLSTYSLAATVWNPVNKTCANAPCHMKQKKPQWGLPWKSSGALSSPQCTQCH